MSGELRVITSHVLELAERQGIAAEQILAAATAAHGVSTSMTVNHGMVCTSANMAVAMAEQARAAACAGLNSVSTTLSSRLGLAASRYDQADTHGAGKLNKEMHPR
ncbi:MULTISPECIES: ESX-1 secretion-associated protein [unclassified Mycolicibacterium]|uniref:ESX-1 secretion-associated protein n=1 Tax=unclassified Mycolicibacterium TaxID=2636767 RepID=UPI0012DBD614|nr:MULTISPECIES: ESX-1 secretion-associated protein [unclassified Mycolicibacterium]MUL81998.1 ESX-1 secretion-associated protein [Mycolicibacterium sp. CBMA 329]MUL87764.1 ESX-1 secretion-associated protein [Mycolicibacterium sp. CBMA 331]MUM01588.1 ESX-1 secretion-associated protein [Mycolicibacterium sp. CBMA 334]MUM27289.1 ESX-1 secretion-associated protein [Mycolicibacterium sp. CBMA 295]MUM38061.1 ESX-1 secretion-associated protein [Mycolicibacterium sp. CBMA 247]